MYLVYFEVSSVAKLSTFFWFWNSDFPSLQLLPTPWYCLSIYSLVLFVMLISTTVSCMGACSDSNLVTILATSGPYQLSSIYILLQSSRIPHHSNVKQYPLCGYIYQTCFLVANAYKFCNTIIIKFFPFSLRSFCTYIVQWTFVTVQILLQPIKRVQIK